MRFTLSIILIISLMGLPGLASSHDTGTTAFAFLKLNGGVRAAGMGEAFVAVADDASAVYWNPAGLTQIESMEFSTMYTSWFAGISYTTLTAVRPFGFPHFGGMSLNLLSVGEIKETTLNYPAGTGDAFSPSAYTLSLSYARKISQIFSLGVNAKVLNESIHDSTVSGYALDLGGLWAPLDGLSFGLAIKNIGSLSGVSNSLPFASRLGAAYRTSGDALLIAADINIPNDNQTTYHIGAEYKFRERFFGRIGYNTRSEEKSGGNLGVGLGLKLARFNLDYAYVPYGELENTHRVGLRFEF